MSQTVGDFFVESLHASRVRRVFGYPSDGINGSLGVLNRAHRKIDYVQMRLKETASFMVSAYAKFTGELESLLFASLAQSTEIRSKCIMQAASTVLPAWQMQNANVCCKSGAVHVMSSYVAQSVLGGIIGDLLLHVIPDIGLRSADLLLGRSRIRPTDWECDRIQMRLQHSFCDCERLQAAVTISAAF